jgi:hypothetical protein
LALQVGFGARGRCVDDRRGIREIIHLRHIPLDSWETCTSRLYIIEYPIEHGPVSFATFTFMTHVLPDHDSESVWYPMAYRQSSLIVYKNNLRFYLMGLRVSNRPTSNAE